MTAATLDTDESQNSCTQTSLVDNVGIDGTHIDHHRGRHERQSQRSETMAGRTCDGQPDMMTPPQRAPADQLDDPELSPTEAEADDIDMELDADAEPDAASHHRRARSRRHQDTGGESADDALLEDADEDELIPGQSR